MLTKDKKGLPLSAQYLAAATNVQTGPKIVTWEAGDDIYSKGWSFTITGHGTHEEDDEGLRLSTGTKSGDYADIARVYLAKPGYAVSRLKVRLERGDFSVKGANTGEIDIAMTTSPNGVNGMFIAAQSGQVIYRAAKNDYSQTTMFSNTDARHKNIFNETGVTYELVDTTPTTTTNKTFKVYCNGTLAKTYTVANNLYTQAGDWGVGVQNGTVSNIVSIIITYLEVEYVKIAPEMTTLELNDIEYPESGVIEIDHGGNEDDTISDETGV